MRIRNLDVNGEWSFGKGLNSYVADKAALILNLSTRLKLWKGECFFDLTSGVDYANLDKGTQGAIDMDIRRTILTSAGVVKIVAYSSTLDAVSRALSVSANIQTIYGTITFNEVL